MLPESGIHPAQHSLRRVKDVRLPWKSGVKIALDLMMPAHLPADSPDASESHTVSMAA